MHNHDVTEAVVQAGEVSSVVQPVAVEEEEEEEMEFDMEWD